MEVRAARNLPHLLLKLILTPHLQVEDVIEVTHTAHGFVDVLEILAGLFVRMRVFSKM